MEKKEMLEAMGITGEAQTPLLADGANVSLFTEAWKKTHVTKLNAANDTTITGAAVKEATDKLNNVYSESILTIGKSLDVAFDMPTFTNNGIFDPIAFTQKSSTDLNAAITTIKDASNGDADEKYKALEATNLKIKGERDTYQTNLLTKTKELEGEKTRNQESEKQTKINGFFSTTFGTINFDEEENDLTIEAIEGRILKGAKHGLDENDKYTITKLDGTSFMNEAETKPLTPSEVHLKFAVDADAKIVMNGIKKVEKKKEEKKKEIDPESKKFSNHIADKMAANAEAIKESLAVPTS